MEPYERRAPDEYCAFLLRHLREHDGRGQKGFWGFPFWKVSANRVPKVFPRWEQANKRGQRGKARFAGMNWRADARIRTGDPFITRVQNRNQDKPGIARVLRVWRKRGVSK